ncbi:MAG: 8-oxo-dGTP diphosphatase MutT [Pseudomonadota bacterium]
MKTVYVAAAALINPAGEILLAQRPEGKAMAGLWEFPGGKIEPDESPEQALCRELSEELGITVSETDLNPITFASHTYDTFHLFMPLYLLKNWRGAPRPNEGQSLAWVAPQDLHRYPAPAADIPLFEVLASQIGDKSHGVSS